MSVDWAVTARRGVFLLDVACRSGARILAVEGASGAGKTTLLYALAGLIPVTRARLAVDGVTLVDTSAGLKPPPHRRRIGYVFQDARLFPHMSVAANIGYGRRFGSEGMSVDAALKLLDLTGFEHRWPASLSGGEMRRVAIARALCAGPRLLLLDEPFAGLDAARREALIPYLLRLRHETDLPMLLVSHDSRDVDALAEDRVRIDFGRVVDAVASGHGVEQPL